MGGAYVFVLEGDGLWYEGTKLITINLISLGNSSGYALALSGDKALIGSSGGDEKGYSSGAA